MRTIDVDQVKLTPSQIRERLITARLYGPNAAFKPGGRYIVIEYVLD